MSLAPYAVSEENSRGRRFSATISRDRNAFERDYSRILHSDAYRRLQGKTQVFSANTGDRFRTRASHSAEVEQVSRAVCRQLRLNETLAATLALGHDIGHAPFGHLGQDVLQELMADHGGFEHNHQALRLVDLLESPYFEHRGLNLMFETREGLLKHCTAERARQLGDVGQRHLDGSSPPLEVQAVDWSDAIAYCHADLEDAFVMKLLTVDDLLATPGYQEAWKRFSAPYPGLAHPTQCDFQSRDADALRKGKAIVRSVIRDMMTTAIDDLVMATRKRLELAQPQSLDEVRRHSPLVGFSDAGLAQHRALKAFSRENIYSHPFITSVRKQERVVLQDLFQAYVQAPDEMSGRGPEPGDSVHRAVADHISGMTDRYAQEEHARLLQARPELLASLQSGLQDAAPARSNKRRP